MRIRGLTFRFHRLLSAFKDIFLKLPRKTIIDLTPNIRYFSQQPEGCGIACLQMILSHYDCSPIPSGEEWIKQAFQQGVIDKTLGMRLAKVNCLIEAFNFKTKVHRYLSAKELATILMKGRPAMVSIKGHTYGHLIVICGVKIEDGRICEFRCYDPSIPGIKIFLLNQWEKISNFRGIEIIHAITTKNC